MNVNFIIAQFNATVGDLTGNSDKIIAMVKAYAKPDTVIIFPEMAITGYPPEDLLLRSAFQQEAMHAVERIALATVEIPGAVIVGGIWMEEDRCYNAAFFMANGETRHKHYKVMLPNYGVFDERRVFRPGQAPIVIDFHGCKIGILICEDIWFEHMSRLLKAQGAEVIVVINASPFEAEKMQCRHALIRAASRAHQMHIIYANASGAQDDIIFDGGSFATNATGEIYFQLPQFTETVSPVAESISSLPSLEESLWKAAVTGLREYVAKNRFSGVVLGLSGGIDSAVVAAMAVDALGKDKVTACMLPSPFTSRESVEDAEQCAASLGIEYYTIPITTAMEAVGEELISQLCIEHWQENLAVGGNIQARLRALYLMAFSNARNLMLLNTSNKSEIAIGYSTLYGDSCGGYSPLKDIYKTQIYILAKWRNLQSPVIPERIISKAPSAELKPGQTDQDQLPEYEVLDAMLRRYIEGQQSVEDLAQDFPREVVEKIVRMIRKSEYKRRQAPPGAKVSSMLFGRDWRYPLSNEFKG